MTAEFLSSLLRRQGLPALCHFLTASITVLLLSIPLRSFHSLNRSWPAMIDHFNISISEALRAGLMKSQEIKSATSKLFENWNLPQDVKGQLLSDANGRLSVSALAAYKQSRPFIAAFSGTITIVEMWKPLSRFVERPRS